MFWITILFLVLVGFVAAGPRLVRSVEALKPAVDVLEPAKPWIGLAGLGWAIYQLIYTLTLIGPLVSNALLFLITYLIALGLLIVLGLYLGAPVLKPVPSGDKLAAWSRGFDARGQALGMSALFMAALTAILDLVT